MDYSKWDALARAEDDAEKAAKEEERRKNREKYFQEQEEKKKKYLEEKKKQKALLKEQKRLEETEEKKKIEDHQGGHAHSHSHSQGEEGHSHSHNGGDPHHHHSHHHHNHDNNNNSSSSNNNNNHAHTTDNDDDDDDESDLRCGCGFAGFDKLQQLKDRQKKIDSGEKKELSLEEKNMKKMRAIDAAREHGKILYNEGNYNEAFQVFERGVLIINGTFGLSDKDQLKYTEIEEILDINMAMCKIKLKLYSEAIDQCKMALNINKNNYKTYYRLGQAYEGMGEYDQALDYYNKSLSIEGSSQLSKEIKSTIQKCKKAQKNQLEKEKINKKLMAERIQKQLAQENKRDKEEEEK